MLHLTWGSDGNTGEFNYKIISKTKDSGYSFISSRSLNSSYNVT